MTETSKKILIVEDHPLFRAMLAQLITQELGMSVCGETNNITDALALIRKELPDAALVDIALKGANGLDLIKRLRAGNIQVPIMVISMHPEKLYAERVIEAGAKGYIEKSASPVDVVAAIKKVVDGQCYTSEDVKERILARVTGMRKPESAIGLDRLSDRELEILELLGGGLSSREIAERLTLSISTIDSYRARIKEKLGIKTAAELYQYAARRLSEMNL